MQEIGKTLVLFGVILVIVGGIFWLFPKIPFLGKLPGDILVKKGSFTFYAPIATTVLISIVLTLLLNLFFARK